VENNVTLIIVM